METHFEIIQWDDRQEDFFGSSSLINTPHMGSVLVEETIFPDEQALTSAIQRAIQVCLHLQIPIRNHFRQVHIHNASGHLMDDWAFSDLAFYLLLLNGNVQNASVSQAQAFAISKVFH